ncbi:MAG: hypothetical protein WC278_05570, partial [Bacilli bacterium]
GDGLIDYDYFAMMYKKFNLDLPLTSEAVGKRYCHLINESEFLRKTKERLEHLEKMIGETNV